MTKVPGQPDATSTVTCATRTNVTGSTWASPEVSIAHYLANGGS